jgi:hypothetical protein
VTVYRLPAGTGRPFPFTRLIPLHSHARLTAAPALAAAAACGAGEKRARRAKLNYLFGRDYKTYLVDSSTKEASEILREKRERKEAQRQGKVYMKERTAAGVAAAGGKAAAKAASAAKAAATKGKGKGKAGKK